MSDLGPHDEHLTEQVAGSVRRPDLAELRSVGRTRARRRRIAGMGGAAGAVALAVLGSSWALHAGPSSGPDPMDNPLVTSPAPGGSATPTFSPVSPTADSAGSVGSADLRQAERLLDSAPLDQLQVAVDPERPLSRASFVSCQGRCGGIQDVLAFTDDGFATRTVVPVSAGDPAVRQVRARGHGVFEVTVDALASGELYDARGRDVWSGQAADFGTEPAALTSGRVVTGIPGSGRRWLQLLVTDLDSGRRNTLALPPGVDGIEDWTQDPSGRLVLLAAAETDPTPRYWTRAPDGPWQAVPEDPAGGSPRLAQVVPGGVGQPLWIAEIGDSGTVLGFRSARPGASWHTEWTTSGGDVPQIQGQALRGGTLVIGRAQPIGSETTPGGLYALTGGSFSALGDPVPGTYAGVFQLADQGPIVVRSADGKAWSSNHGTDWQEFSVR